MEAYPSLDASWAANNAIHFAHNCGNDNSNQHPQHVGPGPTRRAFAIILRGWAWVLWYTILLLVLLRLLVVGGRGVFWNLLAEGQPS